jgi:hypothetical protein
MNKDIDIIIANLNKRNMNGYFVSDRNEAIEKAFELIPEKSTIGFGGSTTLEQIGILDELRTKTNITVLDRTKLKDPNDIKKLYLQMFSSDVFLSSTNAITMEGQLVNVDGRGNRVAMITFGPKKVIIIAGRNKITKDIDSAMKRLQTIACPMNLKRVNDLAKNSPVFTNNKWTKESIWGQVSIIERQLKNENDRIHVIIVDEDLGF